MVEEGVAGDESSGEDGCEYYKAGTRRKRNRKKKRKAARYRSDLSTESEDDQLRRVSVRRWKRKKEGFDDAGRGETRGKNGRRGQGRAPIWGDQIKRRPQRKSESAGMGEERGMMGGAVAGEMKDQALCASRHRRGIGENVAHRGR